MTKQTKSSERRTKVKDLPKEKKELSKKEQQRIKGGVATIPTYICPSDPSKK